MLNFRYIIAFWVTTGIDLHSLMLKKTLFHFLILSAQFDMLFLSYCLFKAPPPEYSVLSLVSSHMPEPAPLLYLQSAL